MGIDEYWMEQAFQCALKAQSLHEIPVGAVLIQGDSLISSGFNQMIRLRDPCAHAEILALRTAANKLNNYRLNQCTLYVTLEPCAMCAAAMVHARIERLVFATRDFKTGAAGSVMNLLNGTLLNHKVHIDEGFLQSRCSQLLRQFFKRPPRL